MGFNLNQFFTSRKSFSNLNFEDFSPSPPPPLDSFNPAVFIDQFYSFLLTELFSDLSLPKHFSGKKFLNSFRSRLESEFEKSSSDNSLDSDSNIFEFLDILFQIAIDISNKVYSLNPRNFLPILERLKPLISSTFLKAFESSTNVRHNFSSLFIRSFIPSNYLTSLSHSSNVLQIYFQFLSSEFTSFSTDLTNHLNNNRPLELFDFSSYFFVQVFDAALLQIKIVFYLFKLHLFLDFWHSSSLDDLFSKDSNRVYYFALVDKKCFSSLLMDIDSLTSKLYNLLADFAYEKKKILPVISDPSVSSSEESLSFLSGLVQSYNAGES